MRSVSKFLPVIFGLALVATFVRPAEAQESSCYLARGTMEDAAQRPSPLGQTVFSMGGMEARLCYGRPSAKGRTVMGELVPFGQPWRFGANEAAAIYLPFAAEVGGIALQPGTYSIYVVPGAGEWTFVLNSNVQRWGIPIDEGVMASDVGRFTAAASTSDEMVEQLTVAWHAHGDDAGHLVVKWEHTTVEIPVQKVGM